MNILVAANYLKSIGGSENYTYAIINELLRLGHHVEYFTFNKGLVSGAIEKLGVRFMSKNNYDLIIASHGPVIRHLFQYGYTIQTTHGILPGLEEPSFFADCHVCVSEFQREYFLEKNIKCDVILNGINCERFYPQTPIHEKLTRVLSLCQSDEANKLIAKCCKQLNVDFIKCHKYKDNIWDIQREINKADLVVGVGRSLYDAMACGRAVISYDTRYPDRNFEGDGYLCKENIHSSLKYNCCGGASRLFFTAEMFIRELMKYNRDDGRFMREFAVKELNIRESVKKYLLIHENNIRNYKPDKKLIACYNEINNEMNNEIAELKKMDIRKMRTWLITIPVRMTKKIIRKLAR
jgi:glycosyltransferase involved in cell wall biosynthesis